MKTMIHNLVQNNFTLVSKTMKTISLIMITLFTLSCSKDDDPAPTPVEPVLAPLQDPLPGYLTASGFTQETTIVIDNPDTYELGYSFVPYVNGKITAIVVKLPDVKNNMRVTIWDKTTATVIRTERIDIATANTEVIKLIAPLDLVKEKEYLISMSSNDYYVRFKTDGSPGVYPFIIGDIEITSHSLNVGTAQTMPATLYPIGYAGDCSFKFQK